jgi:hypothetical protein
MSIKMLLKRVEMFIGFGEYVGRRQRLPGKPDQDANRVEKGHDQEKNDQAPKAWVLAEKKSDTALETPPGGLGPHYARLQQEKLPVRLQDGKAVAPIARQRLPLTGHEHSEDRDHHLVAGE